MKLINVVPVVLAAGMLAACAQGNDRSGGGIGPGDGPADLNNCDVPVTTLCVLGGPNHGAGLVEILLHPDGPLGPIAGEIRVDDLIDALRVMLQNDDGSLAGILQGLLAEGQLQQGLELLLLGDGQGNGGLASILGDLLLGDGEGGGLIGLLGPEGVAGLVQALLLDGADNNCQANLGTLCLVGGDSEHWGLIDLLLTENGVLGALSPHLSQNQLVDILGDMLENDGSLADLVTGLLADGQLAAGLQALLVGVDDEPGGLLQAIQDVLGNLGGIIGDLIGVIVGLLGLGG